LLSCHKYGPGGFEGDGAFFHPFQRVSGVNMVGDTRDSGDKGENRNQSSEEAALSDRLGSLNRRLSRMRDDRKMKMDHPGPESGTASANASAMARGFRLSSELIAGVVVGAVIGWGFDRLLSTSPWGLIVFFLLGFAAGVVNVMRAAGVAPDQNR